MKHLVYLTLLTCILTIQGCVSSKEKTAKEILNDPAQREELFNAILNNRDYLSTLMERVAGDDKYKTVLTRNPVLLKMVCMSDKTDSLMQNDQAVLENMTNNLIKKMEADSFACDKTCTRLLESNRLKKYLLDHPIRKK